MSLSLSTLILVIASIAGLFVCPVLSAQRAANESLFVCGHNFPLLMSLESALTAMADSNECDVTKIKGADADSPAYMLVAKGRPQIVHGELSFIGKRLTLVSKNWDVDVHSHIDYSRVLVGLLHQLESEGHTDCKIKTSYQNSPELDDKTATLNCGSKQIMLVSSEYKGAKSIQITETLGY